MRKKMIAANWKMYKTPDQAREFFGDFLPLVTALGQDTTRRPRRNRRLPQLPLHRRRHQRGQGFERRHRRPGSLLGKRRRFHRRNCTQPCSLAVGVTHVIIGHSERRQYFGETDDTVNLKLKSALEAGLIPIVCVGEVLEEREAGLTDDVLRRQCLRAFNKVSAKKAASLVVAYEPVWAIGTGKTATPQMAADAHASIRAEAAESFGQEFADKLRILYGGSVKPENAHALMSEEEIDGALVGGASLDPKSFAAIVKY